MSSQRKKHSWLSPIVVACCKSKMKQPGPGGTGLESRAREKYFTFYLELEKIQVDGGRNYYSTCFDFLSLVRISKNHEKVLPGTSLFHPEASVNKPNQVKYHHGAHDPFLHQPVPQNELG